MSKRIEKKLEDLYMRLFKKIYTKSRLSALTKGDRLSIAEAVTFLESSDEYNKFAEKFSKELAKMGLTHKRGMWRKYYETAKRLHKVALPKTFHEYEIKSIQSAILENFKTIKSIPSHILKLSEMKYAETMIESVVKGNLSRGAFEKELRSHGVKNAKLIARTETAKIQSAITESRATELGGVAYEWIASNDPRTRPSHREMDGVIVFFRPPMQKPLRDGMRGNAGEFPNCRCDIAPIFDESDLTKSNFNVYDYKSDKIVKMNKNDLIKAIEKGNLD